MVMKKKTVAKNGLYKKKTFSLKSRENTTMVRGSQEDAGAHAKITVLIRGLFIGLKEGGLKAIATLCWLGEKIGKGGVD